MQALPVLFILFLLMVLVGPRAMAAECSIGPSPLDFGQIDTLNDSASSEASTEILINCTEVMQEQVSMCLYAQSPGMDGSGRHVLLGPSMSQLTYRLFTATGQPWYGDQAYAVNLVQLAGGVASGVIAVTGEIDTGQSGAFAGPYDGQVTVSGRYQEGEVSCAGMSDGFSVLEDAAFEVDADVEPNCFIQAEDINFGFLTSLANVPPSSGGVNIECTPGAGYTIALNGGLNWQDSSRHMTGVQQGGLIAYDLITDGVAWGLAPRAYDPSEGFLPIEGQVPSQDTRPADYYQDTVVVTIFYNEE